MDLNAQFFDAVRTERSTMFVILFVVLVVAAFCVMNTLITVTVQKTREIGIMKAIGADVWQIVRVFMAQGVVVGVFGMVSGLGLGLGILAMLNPFKHWMESAFHIELFARTSTNSARSRDKPSRGRGAHLHRGVCDLLPGGADPGVFRGQAGPGEGAAVRVSRGSSS